jgi:hypothetical protein
MGNAVLERPAPAVQPPTDSSVDEQLMLELANVRQVPDWEGLMEQGTTPALVIGGERRSRPR